MKIATHNSGTGEKGSNFWSKFSGFCRCQTKTIVEQYEAGVRLFDFRVRWVDDDLYLCHGLAVYCKSLLQVLSELSKIHEKYTEKNRSTERPVVMITYEGKLDGDMELEFFDCVFSILKEFPKIRVGSLSVKLPKWRTIYKTRFQPEYKQNYPKLVGWKALLPIPILWNRFKQDMSEEKGFVMEDFV